MSAASCRADITQTCVATLEDFDSSCRGGGRGGFRPAGGHAAQHAEAEPTQHDFDDPPDEIVNGRIDLGALTAEFLALALDPYPRKPGAASRARRGDRGRIALRRAGEAEAGRG